MKLIHAKTIGLFILACAVAPFYVEAYTFTSCSQVCQFQKDVTDFNTTYAKFSSPDYPNFSNYCGGRPTPPDPTGYMCSTWSGTVSTDVNTMITKATPYGANVSVSSVGSYKIAADQMKNNMTLTFYGASDYKNAHNGCGC